MSPAREGAGTGLRLSAWILLGAVLLLAAGWLFGLVRDPAAITSRPVRNAYAIADFLLVIPVGIVASLAALLGARWAPPLVAFAAGLLVFDTAHGVLYLFWDNYFGAPLAVSAAVLAGTLAFAVFALRALILPLLSAPGPAEAARPAAPAGS